MCGRYALYKSLKQMADIFGASPGHDGLWDWEPHYNISPGMVVPVMALDGQKRRKLVPMRWGLHPHWKKDPPKGRPLFNARVETAADKPSFRTAYRRRRALIPASGWYEWEGVEKPKTPYFIHQQEAEILAFAGLWDQWRVDEGISLLSMSILTTAAGSNLKSLHHRMPVRLPMALWDDWLDWDKNPGSCLPQQKTDDDLTFHPVSDRVNTGRSNGATLIKPL